MTPPQGVKPGDRIRLLAMPDDPQPIAAGALGTVKRVTEVFDWWQVTVAWDDGRRLLLSVPPDDFEVVA